MKLKLKDARDHLKKLKRRKVKTVKKIFSEFGEEKVKLFNEKLEENSEKLKKEILKKNTQKAEHLSNKFLPDHNVLPDNLSRYRDASVFSSGVCEDEKYTFQQPLVYGELNFDEDEISALLLDPKFAIYDLLSEEDFEVEIETCLAKMRWNNMNKSDEDEVETTSKNEQELNEIVDAKSRQIYDSETKTFDMRKLRATDVKENTYVHLPKSQGVQYESGLEMRRNKYLSVFREYVLNNCDEKSAEIQPYSNGKQRN